jgi:hypothetical protein
LGVPYSHSRALGSSNSCGNLVNSSFFLVKSRYFDETCSGISLVLSLCLYPFRRIRITRQQEPRQLTCILYGRISSPIPIFGTLASIFSVHTILISHSKNSSCDRIKSTSLFRCRWKLGVKKTAPIHSPSIRGSTVAEAHFIPNAPSATLAGTWKLPPRIPGIRVVPAAKWRREMISRAESRTATAGHPTSRVVIRGGKASKS